MLNILRIYTNDLLRRKENILIRHQASRLFACRGLWLCVFVYLVTVAGVCVYAAPCQNVLDYFKTVLEFHNQLVQPMPEEQLTEVRKEGSCALMHSYIKHVSSLAHVNKVFGVLIVRSSLCENAGF